MSMTCPACRHVVEMAPDGTGTCGNCGMAVAAPQAPAPGQPDNRIALPAAPQAAAPAPPTQPADVLASSESEPPRVPASAIVSFVAGLLFFVPILTQVVGLMAAAIALLRPKRTNERRGIAWVGAGLSVVALLLWILLLNWLIAGGGFAGTAMFGPGTAGGTSYDQVEDEERWQRTEAWSDEMRRIYNAASGHRRDFKTWPESIDALAGRYMRDGYTPPSYLTYRPPPAEEFTNTDWALLVSDELRYNESAERLDTPHHLVMRTGGRLDLLPAAEVEALLAAQPVDQDDEAP